MIALLVVGLALPTFAAVAYGVVSTEDVRDEAFTGHVRPRATRRSSRITAATAERVGWLTLAQTSALLAGLLVRLWLQR